MRWFYSLNNPDDPNALMKRVELSPKNCVVCSETDTRQFTSFRTCFEFYEYAKDVGFENNCFYEVIRGNYPQKPYFDIDISLADDDSNEKNPMTRNEKIAIGNRLVLCIVNGIKKIHPQILSEHIFIFNSHGEKKRSYHIVVDHWCFPTYKQNKAFYTEVITHVPKAWQRFCDPCIYKSLQQFRTFFSHKWNTDRIKMLDPLCSWKLPSSSLSPDQQNMITFISSLVSNTDYCTFLPYTICDEIENFSQDISDVDIKAVKDVIASMDDAKSFTVGKISGSVISLNRLTASFCSVCNRVHENENPFVFVNMNNDIFFNCRRGEGSKRIGSLSSFKSCRIISNDNNDNIDDSSIQVKEKNSSHYYVTPEQRRIDQDNQDNRGNQTIIDTESPKSVATYNYDNSSNVSTIKNYSSLSPQSFGTNSIIVNIRQKKKDGKNKSNRDIFSALSKCSHL